jgi:hypothetical protein
MITLKRTRKSKRPRGRPRTFVESVIERMERERTSSSFGGRPRREPEPGERVHLGIRVTPELKGRIEEAAASKGRSQSQEAEFRIERSFDRTELLPEVLALAYHSKEIAGILMALGAAMSDAYNAALPLRSAPVVSDAELARVEEGAFDEALDAGMRVLEAFTRKTTKNPDPNSFAAIIAGALISGLLRGDDGGIFKSDLRSIRPMLGPLLKRLRARR